MVRWLTAAAVLSLFASSSAQAQMKGLGAVEIAEAAKNHTLDFRISQEPVGAKGLPLAPNMLVRRELGPNAAVGLGLANMYERRRGGNLRAGDPPARSRKPAVTFLMKF
jgi:hypothetical protein